MVLFHLIFLLCTTIRPRLRVLTDLFFYLHTTIRQKCIVLFHLFFLLFTTIRPKLGSLLIYFFYLYTTILPNYMALFHLFFLYFVYDHSTKNQGPHQFIYFICIRPFDQKLGSSVTNLFHLNTTIRPKIRVPINLIFLFVNDYSTKNQGPH